MTEPAFPPDDWRVGMRIWVERSGRAILGKGRLDLLNSIGRCHSISAAARELGMSYRHAWLLVQSMNDAAGQPLVSAATGGVNGGGAQLTPLGHWAVSLFGKLQDHLQQTATVLLPHLREGGDAAVHVAAAVSLQEVLGQLLNAYSLQRPDVRIRVVFGASDELVNHLLGGAPGDLLLTADPRQFDRLAGANILGTAGPALLAENGLAAIGSVKDAVPIRKATDLAGAGVTRVALATQECPLGGYTHAYLDNLHLYESLCNRVVWCDNSRAVVTAVRTGQAQAGLVYSSDAGRAEGCRILFHARRLPVPIRYAGAVVSRGAGAAAAQALLAFLTSAAAARSFHECGFRPRRRIAYEK
jgi:molybdenum ABC transporter molybdate-binding protein